VQVQPQLPPATGREQPVLDHARGCGDQAQGVWVRAPMVAGDIQDAHEFAAGRGNRCGRAGQEGVSVEEVLGAVDFHRFVLGEGRSDCIGSAMAFVP